MKISILISSLLFTNFLIQKEIDLRNYQWNNRLICIETNDKKTAEKLLESFKAVEAECDIRKIKFFIKIVDTFYQGLELKQSPPIHNFPAESKSSTISIFLIGLDGGIKQQWNQQIVPKIVFQKIDAMPMRISESKQK